MQLSDLQYLMEQLGPANSDVLLVVQESDDRWQVELEGDVALQISWQAQRGCVIVSCGLGCPSFAEREQVYALLLNANLLLTGISGVRHALSQPDQEIILIGEYMMSSPSAAVFYQHLGEFVHLALKYAALVAQPSQAGVALPMPALAHDASAGFQRV